MSLFRNSWDLPQALLLHSLRHLGQDGFFSTFVVEPLARCPRLLFATSWPASALIPMICFRMSSTGPCCDGASAAFFFLPWQVHPVAISVEQNFALNLRTPEFPFGVPGLSGRDQQRVESSRTLLQRVVQILLAVFSTGGHVCLGQPSSAFSWQDPSVQDFLAETAAVRSLLPAADFRFACSKSNLQRLLNHSTRFCVSFPIKGCRAIVALFGGFRSCNS